MDVVTPGEARLLGLLRGSEAPLTIAQLAELGRVTYGSCRVLLGRLVAAGLAERPGRGRYAAATTRSRLSEEVAGLRADVRHLAETLGSVTGPRGRLEVVEGDGRDQSGPRGHLQSVGVNKRDPRTGQPPVSRPRSGRRAGRQPASK